MAKFIFLGTGSGMPAVSRSASGVALSWGAEALLMDAGDGVARNWLHYVGDYNLLSAVAITHFHADHFSGLAYLVQGLHLSKRRAPLIVLSPPGSHDRIVDYLSIMELAPGDLNFDIDWHPLGGEPFDLGQVVVRGWPNSHLSSSGLAQSYSIELTADGKRAVYSSDLGRLDDLDRVLDPPLDLLIMETTHFPLSDILEYLKSSPPRRVILTHFPDNISGRRAAAIGSRAGGLDVIAAIDGYEVSWP